MRLSLLSSGGQCSENPPSKKKLNVLGSSAKAHFISFHLMLSVFRIAWSSLAFPIFQIQGTPSMVQHDEIFSVMISCWILKSANRSACILTVWPILLKPCFLSWPETRLSGQATSNLSWTYLQPLWETTSLRVRPFKPVTRVAEGRQCSACQLIVRYCLNMQDIRLIYYVQTSQRPCGQSRWKTYPRKSLRILPPSGPTKITSDASFSVGFRVPLRAWK